MTATLYLPHQSPRAVSTEGLSLPDSATSFVEVPVNIAALLDCAPALVDVLASGPGYVVYAIFDCTGEVNHAAMAVVAELSGVKFNESDEDSILRGEVIVVTV